MKQTVLIVIVAMMALSKTYAQGHGPLFGLQTPTLAKGGVDFNAVAMSLATEDDQSFMLRYIWSYGVTEDLQLNITTPTMINRLSDPPRTRGNSNMPANGDIEASVWYRFFSNAFGVGKRFESTAILSVSTPTEESQTGEYLLSRWRSFLEATLLKANCLQWIKEEKKLCSGRHFSVSMEPGEYLLGHYFRSIRM